MKIDRLDILPLEFGHLPTFPEKARLALPAGKRFHHTARIARPFLDYYINQAGFSTVSVNDGVGNYAALPQQYRSTFLNPTFIQNALGGKHWADYTAQDAVTAANYIWNITGGFNTITSGAQEGRGGFPNGDPYAQDAQTNLTAYRALEQRLSELCDSVGGANFGCYDGIYYPKFDNIADVRTALSSDQAALNYLKAHSYGPNPYWVAELWRNKHALLNQYFRSATDLHNRYFGLVIAITLTRMALRAVGSIRRIMTFCFGGKTEFVDYPGQGYSERYSRILGLNQEYFGYDFPDYAPSHQIDQSFFGLDLGDDYFGWEDQTLMDTNPNIVEPNYIRDDGFFFRGQINSSLPTATKTVVFDPNHVYPYPATPEGHNDYAACGALLYQQAVAYGGSNSVWARHRTPGGGYCSTGSGYLADRLEAREATARVARQGTRGWVKIVDNAMPYGNPRELEVDLGNNESAVFLIDACANNLFTFDTAS